jgi:hypothetical protein
MSIEKALSDSENSIVYTYEAEIDKLILDIKYQKQNRLVCRYDNSIDIIENNENKELVNFEDKNVTYASIDLDNSVVYVEENSQNNVVISNVKIINTSNNKEYSYLVEQSVKSIYTQNNVIALNCGMELNIIAKNGWLIKKYTSEKEIDNIIISEQIVGITEKNRILIFNI